MNGTNLVFSIEIDMEARKRGGSKKNINISNEQKTDEGERREGEREEPVEHRNRNNHTWIFGDLNSIPNLINGS